MRTQSLLERIWSYLFHILEFCVKISFTENKRVLLLGNESIPTTRMTQQRETSRKRSQLAFRVSTWVCCFLGFYLLNTCNPLATNVALPHSFQIDFCLCFFLSIMALRACHSSWCLPLGKDTMFVCLFVCSFLPSTSQSLVMYLPITWMQWLQFQTQIVINLNLLSLCLSEARNTGKPWRSENF